MVLTALPARAQTDDASAGWPECEPRQVEVILLGTFHMSAFADEILGGERQAEIEVLVEALARLAPSHVALEADIEGQADLQRAYRAYVEQDAALSANERQQLGFRLARRLGHHSVYAVDRPMLIGNDSISAFYARRPEIVRRYDWVLEEFEAREVEAAGRRGASTIADYLNWLNSEEALASEGNALMYAHIVAGEGSNYGGPAMLEKWYARNIGIAHNVARLTTSDDDRILLVIGSGHVRPLRHLLRLAPQFCPMRPALLVD